MDGLNFKVSGNLMAEMFHQDRYGSFIPDPGNLPMELIAERFRRQLNGATGFYRRLGEIYWRADVMATDNPLGNTPVVGVGFKTFGQRPVVPKKGKDLGVEQGRSPKVTKLLVAREQKIEETQLSLMQVHDECKPMIKTKRDQLLWDVEGDQMMTGGGMDNNTIGEVHKAGLHFIEDSETPIDFEDSALSEAYVAACLEVRDHLIEQGMKLGSIKPVGASYVRAMQDNDGLFGYPAYATGYTTLDSDLATRLLVELGVDTRGLVGSTVTDATTKESRSFALIDAGGYILDNKVFTAKDLVSLVTMLVRIQKHGWKMTDGKLVPKDGKTRAVYPMSFIHAVIEGMIAQPFNEKMQSLKVDIMPSLQDKPTRVEMLKKMINYALQNGYDYLPADWSKWDASVKGHMFATMLQLVVKPFIHADYHFWVDAATVILTYKTMILDTRLASLHAEEFQSARKFGTWTEVKDYSLVGITNGLISGAKWTHVGGSLYGECTIHYAIPKLLGWKPLPGAQAGDDTLVAAPLSTIDLSSVEKTYTPLIDAATKFGLHSNASKQIWHSSEGELVKVFLQDSYHAATDCWGVGSIFRPASAVWFSERDKRLSIAEQLLAEISRMEQGADNPFATKVVEWWLTRERFLGNLFKTFGVSGFAKVVASIGDSIDAIAKRIDVGSFSFSVTRGDLQAGNLAILDVMANVSSQMTFSSEDGGSFLEDLNQGSKDGSALSETDLADSD